MLKRGLVCNEVILPLDDELRNGDNECFWMKGCKLMKLFPGIPSDDEAAVRCGRAV